MLEEKPPCCLRCCKRSDSSDGKLCASLERPKGKVRLLYAKPLGCAQNLRNASLKRAAACATLAQHLPPEPHLLPFSALKLVAWSAACTQATRRKPKGKSESRGGEQNRNKARMQRRKASISASDLCKSSARLLTGKSQSQRQNQSQSQSVALPANCCLRSCSSRGGVIGASSYCELGVWSLEFQIHFLSRASIARRLIGRPAGADEAMIGFIKLATFACATLGTPPVSRRQVICWRARADSI